MKTVKNTVDPRLCIILQEGLIMAYFNGDSISTTMLRIRGEPGMAGYDLLIDEQVVIGWDNLIIWGKFSR